MENRTFSYPDLPAGTYVVVLQDSICTISDTIDIYEPAVLTSSIVSVTDAVCYGTSTGAAEVQRWAVRLRIPTTGRTVSQ
jgi:hypothetical protein